MAGKRQAGSVCSTRDRIDRLSTDGSIGRAMDEAKHPFSILNSFLGFAEAR
jgi:hypothetical protein